MQIPECRSGHLNRRVSVIEARGLAKRFGARRVLVDVTCDIPSGAVTAVIGPNGAGKTTFNKCLVGLVRPDVGTLTLAGRPLIDNVAARAAIGYMPQLPRFPDNLTGAELLGLLRSLRGPSTPQDDTLLQALDVAPLLHQAVRLMSGGQRQRLNAALAFLFAPQVLVLDEPTAGLDPRSASILKAHVRRLRDLGVAVLITSHLLSELLEVADRVVVMMDGMVRHEGPLKALSAQPDGVEAALLRLLDPTALSAA